MRSPTRRSKRAPRARRWIRPTSSRRDGLGRAQPRAGDWPRPGASCGTWGTRGWHWRATRSQRARELPKLPQKPLPKILRPEESGRAAARPSDPWRLRWACAIGRCSRCSTERGCGSASWSAFPSFGIDRRAGMAPGHGQGAAASASFLLGRARAGERSRPTSDDESAGSCCSARRGSSRRLFVTRRGTAMTRQNFYERICAASRAGRGHRCPRDRVSPHVLRPRLRHRPARRRRRPASRPVDVGTRRPVDDPDLHPRQSRAAARDGRGQASAGRRTTEKACTGVQSLTALRHGPPR